jgi:PAS domain S-box-containing protein
MNPDDLKFASEHGPGMAVFENAAVGMALIAPDGRWLRVNAKLCQMTGYSEAELLERDMGAIAHPEDVDGLREDFHGLIRGDYRSCTTENRYIRKDGSVMPVRKSTSLVGDGATTYLVAIIDDISQRKLAEADLAFQKYALDQSAIVAITDIRGAITYVNDQFCAISGYSRDELVGQNHRIINSGFHSREFFREMYLAISGGNVWRGEIRNRRKDGSFYWVDTTIVPALDPQGRPERYVAIRSDITERKHIEEQMRQSEARKDEFLAILSHELRNPLAAIRTAASVLRRDESPAAHTQMVSVIERQAQQLTRLVDDLLDISRITCGKISLRREPIDLAALLAEALGSLPDSCSNHLDLTLTTPKRPVIVLGDPLRILQVVGNLLSNACKFTAESGSVSISLAVKGGHAQVAVRDTGIGLAPDQLLRVFEIFAQVNPEVRKTGGLGIGLALVKGITELHGGSVHVHSDGEGKGSEFMIRLPVASGQPAAAGPAEVPVSAAGNPSRRILAVDDNADALMTIAHLLRFNGHEVITAENGAEAIELAHQHRPEVVLLDIGMPRMDGYEVARRLRRESWGRDLTLIAITGWGQGKDQRQAAAAGFNAHLTKPVQPDVLENLLAQQSPLA